MPENEFEKQVKELMDDLRIAPSEPVWEMLEKRIPKSNRRRRFVAFFFLLAGFAVCGYFVYYKFYSGNYSEAPVKFEDSNAIAKKTIDIPLNNTSDTDIENQAIIETQPNQTLPKTIADEKTKSKIVAEQKINQQQPQTAKSKAYISTKNTNEKQEIIAKTIENHNNAVDKPETIETIKSAKENRDKTRSQKDENVVIAHNDNEVAIQNEISLQIANNDSNTTSPIVPIASQQTNSIEKKAVTKKDKSSNKKISFAITGFYGKSDIIENFNLGLSNADKAYANQNYNGGITGNYGRSDSLFFESKAKDIKARSSFGIGVLATKELSKRSSISAGLEYTRMKTQIQTGILKDSGGNFNYNNSPILTSLASFYTPGGNINQTNIYNFIRVPVFYSYRFYNGKKFYLNSDAGCTLSRLIAADALNYDSYNQAYYKNNDVLNKTHLNVLLGINSSFLLYNNHTLTVGPQAQYSLSGVSKNYTTKQHFFTWGLHARYYFKK